MSSVCSTCNKCFLKSLGPYKLIVPVYPEQPGDIWHGKVLSINWVRQTVDVYFFIERWQEPHRFVRETFGRAARNMLSFESVLAVADGNWIDSNSWEETV